MSKVVAILVKFWHFFYDAHSLNMEKFLYFPNSAFNIRKSYKISSKKALYVRSYQAKTSRRGGGGGVEPPVLLGLRDKQ